MVEDGSAKIGVTGIPPLPATLDGDNLARKNLPCVRCAQDNLGGSVYLAATDVLLPDSQNTEDDGIAGARLVQSG